MSTDEIHIYDPPKSTRCPKCGWQPPEEARDKAAVQKRLSDAGYHHRDYRFECDECGTPWSCGTPAGTYDGGDDLWCRSCDGGHLLTHRIVTNFDPEKSGMPDDFDVENTVMLHLKCPNHGEFACPECGVDVRGVDYDDDGSPACPACREDLDRNDLPGCFAFKKVFREGDRNGVHLVGYPQITGSTDGARPYGYRDNEPGKSDL